MNPDAPVTRMGPERVIIVNMSGRYGASKDSSRQLGMAMSLFLETWLNGGYMRRNGLLLGLVFSFGLWLSACASADESRDPVPSDGTEDSSETGDASETGDPTDASVPESEPEDPCADAVLDNTYKAWPGEDWDVTCPQVQNIDAAKLESVYDYAFRPEYNTQSLLVIRNGAIVAEWYASGKTKDDHVTSWSVAKSF